MKKWFVAFLLAMTLLFVTTSAMAHTKPNGSEECKADKGYTFLAGAENYNDTQHKILCNACGRSLWEDHWAQSGLEATCKERATCGICYQEFGSLGDHVWSPWKASNNGTHIRTCNYDSTHVQTENCTYTVATCAAKATCTTCGAQTGDIDETNHDWSNWVSTGCGTHTRTCKNDPSHTSTSSCSGVACGETGVCTVCGGEYTVSHQYQGSWVGDAKEHWRNCIFCNAKGEVSSHSFSEYFDSKATCVSPAKYLKICLSCFYRELVDRGEIDPNNHDLTHHAAQSPTCLDIGWDAYETCSRCTYSTYQEIPALNHDLMQRDAQSPTCLDIGWDAYETCSRCTYSTYQEIPALNHDLMQHDAQSPTCLDIGWDAYETCSRCDYSTYQEKPALGHDDQQTIIPPTCEKDGYTLHTCSRCPDSYTTDTVTRRCHWFGEWSPNGDGTHSARCLRDGCYRVGTVKCQLFAADDALVCPVCGESSDGARLLRIESARAEAVVGKLPAGELIARMHGDWLSIAFEHAGEITASTGIVRITLPAALLDGKILVYIAPDGTETALTAEIIGETACITLDFSESAVWLIRLTEAA